MNTNNPKEPMLASYVRLDLNDHSFFFVKWNEKTFIKRGPRRFVPEDDIDLMELEVL